MFRALIGDMFTSDARTLVNTVNCVGVMGKGVALKFKERFPKMFADYAERCAQGLVKLGEPYLYRDLSQVDIVNFPTKNHWRAVSRLVDIESGLDYLVDHLGEWNVKKLAMPPLGCGNGGLSWEEVGPLIYRKLHDKPIDVELYAPYGTPPNQLSEEFLSAPAQMTLEGKGRRAKKINPTWPVVVEVLKELAEQPYAPPVGRTIFQKICYVLTEMGVPTGFEFGKGSYGPFSADVMPALHEFANRNWVQEVPLGRMLALRVGEQFDVERGRFLKDIEPYRKKIAKTVDLFSRIKDTEQAEEVLTVLFASRQIKLRDKEREIDEQQIYDYVINWKKSWSSTEKRQAVACAIRNLALLSWIRVRPSESLTEAPF